MSNVELGLWSFPVLLALIFLRMPIGLAMLIVGVVGNYLITKTWNPSLAMFKSLTYSTYSSYSLSVVPLFLLMGQFATQGGLSRALFQAAAAFVGHIRGGLAMASVLSAAAFGAVCGSSVATSATITQVAYPPMKAHGYHGRLTTAALASAGTLGILIPPSVPLVVYAILTEQNVAKLFAAALLPGILHYLHFTTKMIFCFRYRAVKICIVFIEFIYRKDHRCFELLGIFPDNVGTYFHTHFCI